MSSSRQQQKQHTSPVDEPVGELEPVAYFNGPMLTGVTVSREGRIFVNFPKWGDDVAFTFTDEGTVVLTGLKSIPAGQAWFWVDDWQAGFLILTHRVVHSMAEVLVRLQRAAELRCGGQSENGFVCFGWFG